MRTEETLMFVYKEHDNRLEEICKEYDFDIEK